MVMILTKTRENKGADSVTCRTELVSFVRSLFKTVLLPRTLLYLCNEGFLSCRDGSLDGSDVALISTKLH